MKYVFVYGTLRPGQKYHHLIEKFVEKTIPAFVKGRLYHLREGYPALLLERDLSSSVEIVPVRGDLLGFTELDPVLPILDELEDYFGPRDPRNMYERVTTLAITSDQSAISSTVYVFSGEKLDWLERNAVPIPTGDWVLGNS
ncbi:gamma-glutamylcyclotransferase family protein [Effusibacillus consociatus]|uniref:Gamma-glutamylcyclotransferase n=1 Tax=Effusibacillus consociatus TaxID=1117041 RepID=A0ABV9PYS3_9BACL